MQSRIPPALPGTRRKTRQAWDRKMSNLEKYKEAFINGLNLAEEQLTDGLSFRGVTEWDSVGHMNLVAELEDTFDIMMETEDIIDFSSYAKGKEILGKYHIDIE